MSTRGKERVTVTVDPDLVAAGNDGVRAGRAPSLSAWVNLAIAERAAKERRLRALADAVAAYEAVHGVIGADEIEDGDRIATSDPDDIERLAAAAGREVEIVQT